MNITSCPRWPCGGSNSGRGDSRAGDCFRAGLGVLCCIHEYCCILPTRLSQGHGQTVQTDWRYLHPTCYANFRARDGLCRLGFLGTGQSDLRCTGTLHQTLWPNQVRPAIRSSSNDVGAHACMHAYRQSSSIELREDHWTAATRAEQTGSSCCVCVCSLKGHNNCL